MRDFHSLSAAAALVLLAGASQAGGVYPESFDLASLDGTNGCAINGVSAYILSGHSVSGAGDVNGDGIDDVIIGAYYASPNSTLYAGESYVVFGGTDAIAGGTLNLSTLDGTNGFALRGIDEEDRSGFSVSAAGDVNGDEYDDVIVGAPWADPNGVQRAGESYVVFGGLNVGAGGLIQLSALSGANGFVINGVSGADQSGTSVAGAGDVNGDGYDDIIIGAPTARLSDLAIDGAAYVVFGGANVGAGGSLELSSLNGSNGFVARGFDQNNTGESVAGAGDVDGDGFDDIIVGAPHADPNGVSLAGESYVIFGGLSVGSSGTIDLSLLNGTDGFALSGVTINDFSAQCVSGAGDVNGDGFGDVMIGAKSADPNGIDRAGATYIVFGNATVGAGGSMLLSSLNGVNGFVINGVSAVDRSGSSLSAVGDFNCDGIDDLIIGAPLADPNGRDKAGESYVVYGATDIGAGGVLELTSLDGSNGFVIQGAASPDYCGASVSRAGDFNGDGIDDIVIGAEGASPNGIPVAGTSYVVLGLCPDCPGDANGDRQVDITDLNMILGNFGRTGTPGMPGDLNETGTVDINDLNLILGNFGTGCS